MGKPFMVATKESIDLHEDHGHVVMLVFAFCKGENLVDDPFSQIFQWALAVLLQDFPKTRFSKKIGLRVHGFREAIGKKQEQIAGTKRDGFFDEDLLETATPIQRQPKAFRR